MKVAATANADSNDPESDSGQRNIRDTAIYAAGYEVGLTTSDAVVLVARQLSGEATQRRRD